MPQSHEAIARRTLRGLSASAGFASGRVWRPARAGAAYVTKASSGEELQALDEAIAAAVAETARLVSEASGDAADILEFQLAMLEDGSFREAAAEAVQGGRDALTAWKAALDAEAAGYRASSDEYFRARAADLDDIRDRVVAALTGEKTQAIPAGAIYAADDIAPSAFLSHDWQGGGIALARGSAAGHVAILARQRGVPAVVGLGDALPPQGAFALLDAVRGEIVVEPDSGDIAGFEAERNSHRAKAESDSAFAGRPAYTADGVAVKVLVNIAQAGDVASIPVSHVDGVGLMRTEFLYGDGLPDEDEQYRAYRTVLEWAQGRPVTIRTVDAGGDKPVPGFTREESNPFLGVRGIRLCLARPDVFAVQVRALLRAAPHGNLKVMLPMVSVPEEIDAALDIFAAEAAALAAAGVAHAMPPVGIMVEVPAVAITPERFARAAFFSIGSNDLTQYVLAASRDAHELAAIARASDPAVLALVARVANHGREAGKDVGICGDAASDPALVPSLLAAGLRSLSIAASAIGAVKAAIAAADTGQAA